MESTSTYTKNQERVRTGIIKQLSKLNGLQYDLPAGSLTISDRIYLVTGRDVGSKPLGYISNKTEFRKGNPLDIMADYIQKNDFFSLYHHNFSRPFHDRVLEPLSEGGIVRLSESDSYFSVEYILQNGVLVQKKLLKITPEEIREVDYVSDLKEVNGFKTYATPIIGEQKATKLIDRLF